MRMSLGLAAAVLSAVTATAPAIPQAACTINVGWCRNGNCLVNVGTCSDGGSCKITVGECSDGESDLIAL